MTSRDLMMRLLAEQAGDVQWEVDRRYRLRIITGLDSPLYAASPAIRDRPRLSSWIGRESVAHVRSLVLERIAALSLNQAASEPVLCDLRIRQRDGSSVLASTVFSIDRDQHGRLVGISGISRAANQQREFQELSRVRDFYIGLLAAFPHIVWRTNRSGVCVFVNEAWNRATGLAAENAMGDRWLDHVHADDRERSRQAIAAAVTKQEPYAVEYRLRQHDGAWHWVIDHGSPIRNSRGIFSGYVGTCVDIHARREAEQRILLHDAELTAILERVPVLLLLVDATSRVLRIGGDSRLLQRVDSRSLEQQPLLQVLDTLLGKRTRVGDTGDASPGCSMCRAVDAVIAGGGGLNVGEFRCVSPDSTQMVDVLFSVEPIRLGLDRRALVCIQDISDLRLAQEEVRVHHQQLVQADKLMSLGVLVAGVAHEINNPANFISLNAPLLADAWQSARPILDAHAQHHGDFQLGGIPYSDMRDEVPQLFAGIFEGVRRIRGIVGSLKDYARPAIDRPLQEVDLNSVVVTALSLMRGTIANATNCFNVLHASDLPAVTADTQRLEQVIINLVQNSCEHLADPSRAITVRTFWDAAAGRVVLEVKDEGPGIPALVLPRITEPFFTTRSERGGTGLGLSIVVAIVKEFAGSITFDSQPGFGTTVRVALPPARVG